METLKQLISYLIILIDAGAGARFIYCFIRIAFNPDEADSYKKKMVNLGIFLVLANCALVLSEVVKKYVL